MTEPLLDKNERRELGRIQKAYFGFGGYQDVQVGLFLVLGGKAWGVHTSIEGGWSTQIEHSDRCKWTEADRDKQYAEMVRKVQAVLSKAKVDSVDKLVGLPIEATFVDFNKLGDWRILDEVLA